MSVPQGRAGGQRAGAGSSVKGDFRFPKPGAVCELAGFDLGDGVGGQRNAGQADAVYTDAAALKREIAVVESPALAVIRQVVQVDGNDVQEESRSGFLAGAWRFDVGQRSPVEKNVIDGAGCRLSVGEGGVGGAAGRARVMRFADAEEDSVGQLGGDL